MLKRLIREPLLHFLIAGGALFGAYAWLNPAGRGTAARGGREVRIEIGDTGPGMDAEVFGNLFRPYFTTKPAGEGTGLGLMISKDIVERHGGRIDVDSAPGQGTRFTIVLPLPAAAASA